MGLFFQDTLSPREGLCGERRHPALLLEAARAMKQREGARMMSRMIIQKVNVRMCLGETQDACQWMNQNMDQMNAMG